MFDRFTGVQPNATSEGTHFLVPWLQRAILYDVRIKPRVRFLLCQHRGAMTNVTTEYLYDNGVKGFANGFHHAASDVETGCAASAQNLSVAWHG